MVKLKAQDITALIGAILVCASLFVPIVQFNFMGKMSIGMIETSEGKLAFVFLASLLIIVMSGAQVIFRQILAALIIAVSLLSLFELLTTKDTLNYITTSLDNSMISLERSVRNFTGNRVPVSKTPQVEAFYPGVVFAVVSNLVLGLSIANNKITNQSSKNESVRQEPKL